MRSKLNLNQWQNSSEVIDWFRNIQQKISHIFTAFDIQQFYPSITEKDERCPSLCKLDLIFHTRKSLLYCKNTPWIKKGGNGEFDVTMGSNDGAEMCKLVELFLLYSIGEKLNKDNIGLYRDYSGRIEQNTEIRETI